MKLQIKILFFIAVLTSISYSIVNAFFAPIAIRKNVPQSTLGAIISIYSIVVITITPFISNLVVKFGRKNLFVYSLLFQVIFTMMYGIIAYIQDYNIFVFSCFALRISHGISSAFNINLLISTTAKLSNKDEVSNNFAMIDLGWMFGKFCGPTIISLVYYYGGLFFTFLISAITLLIAFIYAKDIPIENEEIKQDEIKENFFTSLEKFDIFVVFFCQFLNMLSKTFFGPIIFNHIFTKFSISLEGASNMLSLSFISYYITIYNIDKIIRRFGTKMTITFGILLNFISVNLLHPISIFPQSAILIAFGFLLLGFPSGCIDIPVMVDLVNTFKEKYDYPDHLANDITSSIYTFANQMGESLGPIYGGYITYGYGFETACICTGIINFLFLIYFGKLHKNKLYDICSKDVDKENLEKTEIYNDKRDLCEVNLQLNEKLL